MALNRGTVEADAIGEQQLKWTQAASSSWSGHNQGAAVEGYALGEQQLKRTHSGSSSSAQRAVRRCISHVGERGGK